ncbi:MAG: zinc-binding dehydrogenase [Calditrichaeota bacterium]|nr:zinc-binding dehydrogenase [Calditrichota bacterium]MCB0268216.1 zinc-binding dehydrogenase [Calditrichota bacterium]MCB9068733.1 zinc-binding dehydrogenase [Calditrichia bacterium]
MRAVILQKTGNPHSLHISDAPEPKPGPGQVSVKLQFSGINYAEILSRKGLYGWAVKRPYILGMEGSGIIEAVGDGVNPARVGQAVMVGTQNGCYAEKIVVPSVQAIPVISGFEMSENAAFLVNFMTAWVSLFSLAKLQPGEKVLITAAAGGVGSAAVQLAVKHGCEVYALAGNAEKIKFLKSLGVTGAISYHNPGWQNQLRDESNGLDVVLEMVGGEVFRQAFSMLNPLGRLTIAGYASMDLKKWNPVSWWQTWRDAPKINIMKLAHKSSAVMATHLGYLLKNPDLMQQTFADLEAFVVANNIRPVVGKIFPLENVGDAHQWIESRNSIGKVLLKI